MMPALLERALGSILRWILAFGGGYLISKGIWTEEEGLLYIGAAASALAALLWSLWQKYSDRLKFLAARDLPKGASGEKIREHAKDPDIKAQAFQ